MNTIRTYALAAAAVVVSAATVAAQTNGSGIPITKDGAGTTTTATATGEVSSLPAFSVSAYPALTLGTIAAHLLSGDSAEIRMAELAERMASAQAVHDYASLLANEHAAHLKSATDALDDEDAVPQPLASDVEAERMVQEMARLQNMPAGPAWDAEFVRFQVQHHANEIALLNANRAAVHGNEMRTLLDNTIAALTKHRDVGRSTAATLGITLY